MFNKIVAPPPIPDAKAKKNKPKLSLGRRIWRILSGFEIAVICLSLLFLLTFFGTIEQKWFGLWSTIHKYFDYNSLFVIPRLGDGKIIFLPLPGAYWVIVLLSINMFCGGIVRARKGWKKAGVLVSHFAILFMLIAGAVSSLAKEEGHMRVLQGEKSDYAAKLFKHDIEIFDYDENGDRNAPAIIRSKYLKDLDPNDKLKVTFDQFDFSVQVDSYLPYSDLKIADPRDEEEVSEEIVDGFYLSKIEKDIKEEERNFPGLYLTVLDPEGEEIQRLLLWSAISQPVTFDYDGKRYGVTLGLEIWPMPFEVELHRTFGEYHPGTQIPRWFQSDITKVDDSEREDYKIVMNEPARHGGYTLYQAGFTRAAEGETPSSTFAVVNNPSDKWPEYALYISALGLTFHFLLMLILYVIRSGSKPKSKSPTPNTTPVES